MVEQFKKFGAAFRAAGFERAAIHAEQLGQALLISGDIPRDIQEIDISVNTQIIQERRTSIASNEETFYNGAEAASILGLDRSGVSRIIRQNKLQAEKKAGHYVINATDLRAYQASQPEGKKKPGPKPRNRGAS